MENNQVKLPNATAVLVLGIRSIPTCFCFGLVGLVCGIIALIMASKASAIYSNSPETYTKASLGNLKAGKICAIVGTSLSALYFLYIIIYFAIAGTMMASLPWEQMMNAQ